MSTSDLPDALRPETHARQELRSLGPLYSLDEILHLTRYEWAIEGWVRAPHSVADLGCGTGIGMRLLDGVASESVGVDLVISPAMQDLNAIEADVSHPSLPDILGRKGFDVVLSMETIEHLEDYFTFVRNCAELLRENGVAIVSTPNRRLTYERYSNRSHMDPSHVQEFTPVSFRETLGFAFQRVELFYQSIPGFWAIPEASNSARSEPAERRDVAGLRDYVPPIVWRSVRRLRRPPRRAIEGASPQQFARDRVQIAREYGGSETDPFALIAVCSDPL